MEKISEISKPLYVALEDAPFSERFKSKARELGFPTVSAIVELGWVKLQKLEGFDYGCLNELIRFLDERNQLYLLLNKE